MCSLGVFIFTIRETPIPTLHKTIVFLHAQLNHRTHTSIYALDTPATSAHISWAAQGVNLFSMPPAKIVQIMQKMIPDSPEQLWKSAGMSSIFPEQTWIRAITSAWWLFSLSYKSWMWAVFKVLTYAMALMFYFRPKTLSTSNTNR